MAGREGTTTLERVESALAQRMPEVDLLEFTIDGEMMRLVVDHPAGVDHDVCVAVTRTLGDAGLLEDFGAEVWSPGPEPPMRLPEHFRRARGRRVKVRSEGDWGRVSHTGTLLDVDDDGVQISVGDDVVEVPFATIRRARILEEPSG